VILLNRCCPFSRIFSRGVRTIHANEGLSRQKHFPPSRCALHLLLFLLFSYLDSRLNQHVQ
jgi:hypothetical protein